MDAKMLIDRYLKHGIISSDDIIDSDTEDVMQTIISRVHKYAIKQTPDGRYTTYVPDGCKPNGRRQIRLKSKTELYRVLCEFYDIAPDECTLTVEQAFELYFDYKEQFIEAENPEFRLKPQSLRRYENDFVKYIKDTELGRHKIANLKKEKLVGLLSDMVRTHRMSKTCAKNVLLNVQQVFRHAWQQDLIAINPAEKIDKKKIMAFTRYVPKKTDEEQVLSVTQISALLDAVYAQERKKPGDMANYAIQLGLLAGCRVGEFAALHWSDVDDEYIRIDHSENRVTYRRKHGKRSELVIDEPKNRKHRKIPLTDEMRVVLDKARSVGYKSKEDFVFVHADGTRYTEGALAAALKRRATEAGLSKVSFHRIRRTISSMLNAELPQKTVSAILGHTEPVNEQHYNYATVEQAERKRALSSVSSKVINFRAGKEPLRNVKSG